MGSGTHCSIIDGSPGTHGTHANEATADPSDDVSHDDDYDVTSIIN